MAKPNLCSERSESQSCIVRHRIRTEGLGFFIPGKIYLSLPEKMRLII